MNALREWMHERMDRDAQSQRECASCGRTGTCENGPSGPLCESCGEEAAREWAEVENEQQRDFCATRGV